MKKFLRNVLLGMGAGAAVLYAKHLITRGNKNETHCPYKSDCWGPPELCEKMERKLRERIKSGDCPFKHF